AGPIASWWYFYDESFYWSTKTQLALKFQQPGEAIAAIDTSLALFDPTNLHERAHRSLHRVEAMIQQENISDACTTIGEIAQITTVNASKRVALRINNLREALAPWERTKSVRDLDELLAAYKPSFPAIRM